MKNGTTAKAAPAPRGKDNVPATGAPPKPTAKERAAAMLKRAGVDATGMTYVAMRSNIKTLMAEGKLTDGRIGNEDAGRPTTEETIEARGLSIILEKHANETVKVTIRDKRSGQSVEVEKPRILVALEKLFERATNEKGETQALEKWLDRALGKAPQAVAMKHTGEIGTYTAKRPTAAALAAKRAYEQATFRGT